MGNVVEKIKEKLEKKDEYEYSLEELERKIERGHQDHLAGRCAPFDEKFKRYLDWMIDDMENGYPSNKVIPEEFRCFIK